MPDTEKPAEAAAPVVPPKRHPGHRGQDVRDTVAEMAAKAHEISLEAGSKMAAAMKDVVGAAAGLVAFSIESTRDLVQYMVRRGQMTQEEADKLVREAEGAWLKKNKGKELPKPGVNPLAKPVVAAPAKPAAPAAKPATPAAKPAAHATKPAAPAAKPAAAKPVAKPAPAKPVAKHAPAKKPAAKKPAPKK
jgi:polyhydroxyalkanoate synthesis regulator phasin